MQLKHTQTSRTKTTKCQQSGRWRLAAPLRLSRDLERRLTPDVALLAAGSDSATAAPRGRVGRRDEWRELTRPTQRDVGRGKRRRHAKAAASTTATATHGLIAEGAAHRRKVRYGAAAPTAAFPHRAPSESGRDACAWAWLVRLWSAATRLLLLLLRCRRAAATAAARCRSLHRQSATTAAWHDSRGRARTAARARTAVDGTAAL